MFLAAVVNGHLSALASISHVTDTLVDHILYRISPPDVSSLLPILCVDQVLGGQSCCRSNDASMFSKGGHVEGDLACMDEGVPCPLTLRRMLSISSTKIIVRRMRARYPPSQARLGSRRLPSRSMAR